MANEVTNNSQNTKTLLSNYIKAFSAMDDSAASQCFVKNAVVEVPIIKSSRLVGRDEIARGHALAFENLTDVNIALTDAVSNDNAVMASGHLSVVCRNQTLTYDFGVSAESQDSQFARLSWFIDSRGNRLWSDRCVL